MCYQRHLVHSPKVGRHPTIAHYNGTQQWHHVHSSPQPKHNAMASCNSATSALSGLVVTLPHNHSTLPAMAPRPLNHRTLEWHLAMAPSNGNTRGSVAVRAAAWQSRRGGVAPPRLPRPTATLKAPQCHTDTPKLAQHVASCALALPFVAKKCKQEGLVNRSVIT